MMQLIINKRYKNIYTFSKEFVESKILNKEVFILTKKDSKEKYGRYLAWVYYLENDKDWVCLNNKLIELNLAVPFMV